MKKLSLGKLKLASDEVLHRSQLSMIYGGNGGSACSHTVTCKDSTQIAGSGECPSSSSTVCSDHDGLKQCVQTGC